MKILLVHNYLRPPSGENTVFEQERDLLRSKGDTVITYTKHNKEIDGMQPFAKAFIPVQAHWSSRVYYEFLSIIETENPDIVHFHNVFPLISPSAYRACKRKNIPVVQTLHHYRIICPGGLLFRDNKVCTDCAGMRFLPGIRHGCYRNSRLFTAGMAGVVLFHKLLGTWMQSVDLYIALSEFARAQYAKLGFPSSSFFVKPNFLQNPVEPHFTDSGYGLYMGRIGAEKGMECLMSALRRCPTLDFKIIGDGPLREQVIERIEEWGLRSVEYLGVRSHAECMHFLSGARFHVLPSQCYEGIPMVMLEAMAAGKPSVVSDIGVLPMMVEDGVDGLVFPPGEANVLAERMSWMDRNAADAREMGRRARETFERNYTKEKNYGMIMAAYQRAIEINRKRKKAR